MKYPQPDLHADTRKNDYVLADDYTCPLPRLNCSISVKRGQRTDGASIPRLLWVIIGHPFTPDYIAAAFTHDCLYASHVLPRRASDEVFRRILLSSVGKSRARVLWSAVRLFGWLSWRRHPSSIKAALERISITTLPASTVTARPEESGPSAGPPAPVEAGNSIKKGMT